MGFVNMISIVDSDVMGSAVDVMEEELLAMLTVLLTMHEGKGETSSGQGRVG